MNSFWAIVKLTFRNAFRSHIFQLLLLLLLLSVIIIPSTVSGDGTAGGFIRVSLLYSLSTVGSILALSSIWLGCHAMTQDIDNYQLHMVVTKPISRIRIWLAKWMGIYLVHLILLLVASGAIYFIILYKYNQQDFPPAEREKIRNEVMVGRRGFWPKRVELDKESQNLVKAKIERLRSRGQDVDTSPSAQDKMLKEARIEILSRESELEYNVPKEFEFTGLPTDLDKPLFLRYRPYVGKIATEGQRMTRSLWVVAIPKIAEKSPAAKAAEANAPQERYAYTTQALSEYPEQVMSGEFHEKILPASWKVIAPDGTVKLGYFNFDDMREKQYFQPGDGPQLLIEVTGFFENYLRSVAVVALELLILCGLGCAFGGILTLPTAIFVAISYMLFGSVAVYMTSQEYLAGVSDHIGQLIAKLLLWIVIPLQAFEVSGLVANGEVVEFSYFWALFKSFFIYRALPLFLLGMILYRRRELGLVIRK
ncbi:MAG: hypothetical protein LBM70_06300 [Victivallales bacterium]|jgi:hypothetical protein|nr:hypothetical protein [Victivallales bacterium]